MFSGSSDRPGRRPATAARTGALRRQRARQLAPSTASSSVSVSSRLSRLRSETGGNHIAILNRLVKTLQENGIPGPQFFRLKKEFSKPLGEGGQGNVRGINEESAKRYKKANKNVLAKWPVELIAIKQYQRKTAGRQTQQPSEHDLGSRFRAAECEVLALSPNLFRGRPNIVQLMGWGLCLDTVEAPNSPCCESLQIPVLVLERGEMNLLQFLRIHMPQRIYGIDSRVEEGLACSSPSVLSGGGGTERLKSSLNVMSQWAGFQMDPYETIRLLCIDIGHGLQNLHEEGFTHGDLKPENVLLFRRNVNGWRAKLCDFGCAHGKAEETMEVDGVSQVIPQEKEEYLGTDNWRPPKYEAEIKHDHEGLRRCDLFVYGLLLWSCFGLRGEPPPDNPSLEDALADLEGLVGRWRWLPRSKHWLVNRITEALKKTMTNPEDRDSRPWEYLYTRQERASQDKQAARNKDESSHDANTNDSPPTALSIPKENGSPSPSLNTQLKVRRPLSRLAKAKYNEMSWWQRTTGHDTSLTTEVPETFDDLPQLTPDLSMGPEIVKSQTTNTVDLTDAVVDSCEPQQAAPKTLETIADELPEPELLPNSEDSGIVIDEIGDPTSDPPKFSFTIQEHPLEEEEDVDSDEEGSGPATSKPLSSDDNSLSTALFQDESRRRDAEKLLPQMIETVELLAAGTESSENLYHFARFRSRIRLEWWEAASSSENILDRVLQLVPVVDINTLAWLCKGPVGKLEVQSLTGDYATWKVMLDSEFLNESERLDRFLLLLQFGARIEQRISRQWNSNEVTPETSIFTAYIKTCREGILPTVVAEICKRFEEVEHSGSLLPSTRIYMRSRSSSYSTGNAPTLEEDLRVKGNLKALAEFWKRGLARLSNFDIPKLSSQPSENTALLPLPFGWRTLDRAFKIKGMDIYEEEFTQSITLTKPKVSLIKLRQIEIGYLNKGKTFKCHLDLAWGTSLRMGIDSKILTKEMTNRFPYYDESWFDAEWTTEPSQKDVLGSLREQWKLPTFAIRVQFPEIDLAAWTEWAGSILLSILKSIAGAGLVLGLIVVLFPLVVYFILLGIFITVLIAPAPSRGGWTIIAALIAKVAAIMLWLKIIDWTCPGAGPKLGDDGHWVWPHGKENCATCWWIVLSWWSCK